MTDYYTISGKRVSGGQEVSLRQVKNAIERAEQLGVDLDAPLRCTAAVDLAGAMAGQGSPVVTLLIPLADSRKSCSNCGEMFDFEDGKGVPGICADCQALYCPEHQVRFKQIARTPEGRRICIYGDEWVSKGGTLVKVAGAK